MTAPNPQSVWLRYVDDTFAQLGLLSVEEFYQHLTSMDTNIKFTTEESDGKLPCLDTLVHLGDSGETWVTLYRRATLTDQYLNFGANRHLQHKRSLVETLMNRANKIISKQQHKHRYQACKINRLTRMEVQKKDKEVGSKPNTNITKTRTPSIGLPYIFLTLIYLYIGGQSEKLTPIFKQHGIGTFHNILLGL